jgi:hypothetical protein
MVNNMKKNILIFILLLGLFFIPIKEVDFGKASRDRTSLTMKNLYLSRLKLHFTKHDFSSLFYMGYGKKDELFMNQVLSVGRIHLSDKDLMGFALFYPNTPQSKIILTNLNFKDKDTYNDFVYYWCQYHLAIDDNFPYVITLKNQLDKFQCHISEGMFVPPGF